MTDPEFIECGDYLVGLWAEFALSKQEEDLWRSSLRKWDLQTTRSAIAEVYKRSKFKTPKLAEVLDILRGWDKTKTTDMQARHDYMEKDRQEHEACMEDLRYNLSEWTDADLAEAKAFILTKEPQLSVYENLSPRSQWWLHFIHTRMVEKQVTIYPRGRGQSNQRVQAQQMSVDDWWRYTATVTAGPLKAHLEVA